MLSRGNDTEYGDHRVRTVSISDRRENEVRREVSLLSWRISQVRGCQWAERLLKRLKKTYISCTQAPCVGGRARKRFHCKPTPDRVCF